MDLEPMFYFFEFLHLSKDGVKLINLRYLTLEGAARVVLKFEFERKYQLLLRNRVMAGPKINFKSPFPRHDHQCYRAVLIKSLKEKTEIPRQLTNMGPFREKLKIVIF